MNSEISLPQIVQEIVADFAGNITAMESLVVEGIYLTGSLPMNDFHTDKSDIDFLVLCKELPDPATAKQLKLVHRQIAKRYSGPELSGAYVTLTDIKVFSFEAIKTLTYHQGKISYRPLSMAPIVLAELTTNAITVFGIKAGSLPFEVKEYDLYHFLYENIGTYWTNWIGRYAFSFPYNLMLLLFPRLTEWSVLGVARQLCTLQTGRIVSKTQAGTYCLEQLPERFHPIIRQAIEIRNDSSTQLLIKRDRIKPSFKRRKQTIACVNYIIDTFNETYSVSTFSTEKSFQSNSRILDFETH